MLVDMKDVVVYLTRSSDTEVAQLLRSLRLLSEHFLPWSPADVIVFHEADLDTRLLRSEESIVRLGVRFAQVDFSSVPPGTELLSRGQRGYRHMCHFFANDIFLREELRTYRYYMRLDVDSFILSDVKFNVFEKMAQNGIKYTYRMEMREKRSVSSGLMETVQSFFNENPGLSRAAPDIRHVCLYYTNFEICDLAYFRGTPWQRFFAAIDAAGGIWRHRWGDAPIRWMGLKYLLPEDEMLCLKCMTYRHQFVVRKGFTFRLPLEYARCVIVALAGMARERLKAQV